VEARLDHIPNVLQIPCAGKSPAEVHGAAPGSTRAVQLPKGRNISSRIKTYRNLFASQPIHFPIGRETNSLGLAYDKPNATALACRPGRSARRACRLEHSRTRRLDPRPIPWSRETVKPRSELMHRAANRPGKVVLFQTDLRKGKMRH